jgi:hypothetical protein
VASVVAGLLSSGNYFNELKSFKEQSKVGEIELELSFLSSPLRKEKRRVYLF